MKETRHYYDFNNPSINFSVHRYCRTTGGDEFTVLAVDALKDSAQTMTESSQEGIRKHNLQNLSYQLSLSVGMIRFDPQIALSLHELMIQVDKALYEEKRRKT